MRRAYTGHPARATVFAGSATLEISLHRGRRVNRCRRAIGVHLSTFETLREMTPEATKKAARIVESTDAPPQVLMQLITQPTVVDDGLKRFIISQST